MQKTKFHTIMKLLSKSAKEKDGRKYFVYEYRVADYMGNLDRITSLQKYEVGELCRAWFSKFNAPNIGKLCQDCLKPIKNEAELVNHEYCTMTYRNDKRNKR